jgi:hypothetical protein
MSAASHELRIFVDSSEEITGVSIARLRSSRGGFRPAPDVPNGKRILPSRSSKLARIDSLAANTSGLVVTVYQSPKGQRGRTSAHGGSTFGVAAASSMSDSSPIPTADGEAIVDAALVELESYANEVLAEGELLADEEMLATRAGLLPLRLTSASPGVASSVLCAAGVCQAIQERRAQYQSGQRNIGYVTLGAMGAVVAAAAATWTATAGIFTAAVAGAVMTGLGAQFAAGESLWEKARALRRCYRGEEVNNPLTRRRYTGPSQHSA